MKPSPPMRTTCALLASLALVALTACGGGKASAPDPSQPSPAAAPAAAKPAPSGRADRALLTLFQNLAAKVKSNGSDCNRFGALLQSWVARKQGRVKSLVKQVESKASSMSQPEVDDLKARLTDAFQVVITRANQCKAHPAAESAFQAFDKMIQGT